MKLLTKLLRPSRNNLSSAPGQPVRLSDRPVQTGDIISAGEFDASWHVVTAVGSPIRTWDDDLQFHRKSYPYQARMATSEDMRLQQSRLETGLSNLASYPAMAHAGNRSHAGHGQRTYRGEHKASKQVPRRQHLNRDSRPGGEPDKDCLTPSRNASSLMITKRTAIPSLTGIRGVAALWVVIFHLTLNTAGTLLQAPDIAKFEVFSRGWAGVDMFFVLSGYILMHSHGDEFASLSRKALIRFARSRFMRVYPLSAVVLALIALLCLFDPKFWIALQAWSPADHPISAFLRTAVLGTRWLPGQGDFNPPTWSLSAEILGYAAFPVLAWLLVRARSFTMLIGIAASAFGALIAFQVVTHSVAANDIYAPGALIRMACSFVAGAALARARPATPAWITSYAGVLSVAVTVAIILSLFSWRGSAAMPAEFGALIFFLSFQKGVVNQFLCSRPVLFLGRISFSLYLIHVQLLLLMEIHLLPQVIGSRMLGALLILAYFASTLLLSWLLYSFVECPFQQLGRSMAQRAARQPVEASGYDTESEIIRS